MINRLKLYIGNKIVVALFLFVIITVGVAFYKKSTDKIVLTIGTYTGSNWDVPSGQGTQFLDQVIQVFEKKYPRVEVRYETGIEKEDYSDWLADQIVSGEQPDIFIVPEHDFNLLASTGKVISCVLILGSTRSLFAFFG